MFLLDTNVVSELRKAATGKADAHVLAWATRVDRLDMFLSVVSLLELKTGILLLARRDPTQAANLSAWFENQLLPAFSEKILPIDHRVALQCAQLHVPDPQPDRDALIAATALVHGLCVVTRNIDDFKSSGVQLLNPWQVSE